MSVGSKINANFPVPGVDQSSRGFRDNFGIIKQEIENLQSKRISLIGGVSTDPIQIGSDGGDIYIPLYVDGANVRAVGANLSVQINNGNLFAGSELYYNQGRLGINTNSPITALDVRGNARIFNQNVSSQLEIGPNLRISTNTIESRIGVNNSGVIFIDHANLRIGIGSSPVSTNRLDVDGNIRAAGSIVINGTQAVPNNGILQVFGASTVGPIFERTQYNPGAPSANIDIDAINNTLIYFAGNATGNINVNIRGSSVNAFNSVIQTGQAATIALALTNGATNFFPRVFTIDSNLVIPRWANNVAVTSGNNNSIDFYNISIFKNANHAYNVFVTQSRFA